MINICRIPAQVLNRQKDIKDGKCSQVVANGLDNKFPENLKQLKKIWAMEGCTAFEFQISTPRSWATGVAQYMCLRNKSVDPVC